MYQLWSFISPGLHETERRATLSYIPLCIFTFVGGISFAYFVLLPYVMKFMMNLSVDLGITQTIGINEYFTFFISNNDSIWYCLSIASCSVVFNKAWHIESNDTCENTKICLFWSYL